jgi:hypothetical protein
MPKGSTTCEYDEMLGMFKVLKAKGKSISSGGYGVPHSTPRVVRINFDEAADVTAGIGGGSTMKNPSENKVTHDYLFIEETLFLHERGMLAVYHPGDNQKLMNTQDMYEIMLHKLNMPLAIYLSYSHLRAQTFIVIRHTEKRLELIRKIGEQKQAFGEKYNQSGDRKRKVKDSDSGFGSCEVGKGTTSYQSQNMQQHQSDDVGNGKEQTCTQYESYAALPDMNLEMDKDDLMATKKEIRNDAFHAPQPKLFRDAVSHDSDTKGMMIHASMSSSIAYDVYNPNSNYKKTMPDRPDFYVAVVPYVEPSPTFSTMKAVILACKGIPIKISTVSDGGTVNTFGITDLEVPSINEKE